MNYDNMLNTLVGGLVGIKMIETTGKMFESTMKTKKGKKNNFFY